MNQKQKSKVPTPWTFVFRNKEVSPLRDLLMFRKSRIFFVEV